tara:strand:- start:2896 stop:5646 length:2751 start_codon:yes stop_codon:yes gene_type:complete
MINNKNLWNLKTSNDTDSIFNDYYATNEPVNVAKIHEVLKSGWNHYYNEDNTHQEWAEKVSYTNAVTHLKKIMNNVKDGMVNTNLKINNVNGIGRASYKNFISLSSLPRALRQLLSLGLYKDYDIDNCHFSILYNICKKMKIPKYEYANIEKYCTEREEVLKNSVEMHYGKELNEEKFKECRGKNKTLFIIIQFMGSYDKWMKDNNIDENSIDPFIPILKNEIQSLINTYIIPNNKGLYSRIKQDIAKKKKKAEKTHTPFYKNPLGSLSSQFTQHYERIIIETVLTTLKNKNKIQGNRFIYMFDGFQLTNSDSENITCKEIKKIVKNQLGFKLDWSIKEMDEGEALQTKINLILKERKQKLLHPPEFLDEFTGDYFKKIKGNYILMKDYFEQFICFVELPEPLFWKIENIIEIDHSTDDVKYQKKISHLTKQQLKEIYGRYGSGSFTQQGKEKKFLDCWLDDEDIRTYKCLDFYPRNCDFNQITKGKHYLNTFCGYPDFLFDDKLNKEPQMINKIIKPFQDVLVNVLGGDRMDMEHFEMLLAYKIKYPAKKQPYTIVIMGLEGEGKNVVLDVFGNIVGQEHYITTSKIGDICDTHAEGLYHKLIANMNEMGFGDSEKYANVLKSLCSENTMIINPKNVRPFKIHNHALLIITSNENLPIKLDIMNSDRRNCIFKGNGHNIAKYKGKGVWKKLVEYFKKEQFLKSYYDYLMSLDIDSYDYTLAKRNNEQKPAYNSVAQYFYPAELLFFKDFINLGMFTSEEEEEEDSTDEDTDLLPTGYSYFPDSSLWTCTPEKHYYEYKDFTSNKSFRLKELLSTFKSWCKSNGFGYSSEKSCKSFSNKIFNLKLPLVKATNNKNQTVVKFIPSDLLLNLYNKKIVDLNTKLDWFNNITKLKIINSEKNGSAQIKIDDIGLIDFEI